METKETKMTHSLSPGLPGKLGKLARFACMVLTLAAVLPATSASAAIDAREVDALMASIDKTGFPRMATATIKITSYKKEQVLKEINMDFTLSSDKALLGITAPVADKGKYVLRSGKNMWMYFSDIKRSIRLSSRDAFLGTDANNYDLLQIRLQEDYTISSFSEAMLNGEAVWKVELSGKEGTDGYHKIISWVSPKTKRLLQNDCFSISGAQIKTIQYRNPVAAGDFRIPSEVFITNFVDKNRTTLMQFSKMQPRTDIKASMFTLGYLEALN